MSDPRRPPAPEDASPNEDSGTGDDTWTLDEGDVVGQWTPGDNDDEGDDPRLNQAAQESLQEHLRWQLHLLNLSQRDRSIGLALIDAIDGDGYLREPLEALVQALQPELSVSSEEILAVLRHIQGMEPTGVGARDLGECLALQLQLLPADTEGRALALQIAQTALARLPRAGIDGLARELRQPVEAVASAVSLLRRMEPRPGRHVGQEDPGSWVLPDVVIWRQRGRWQAALAGHSGPPVVIHRGYEQMLGHCSSSDASSSP